MGCSETKPTSPNLPVLTMIFEPQNDTQKDYCIKIQQNFRHARSIKYEIKSFANSTFSIMFQINGTVHQIQNIFNENEYDNTLQKLYELLDQADTQAKPDPNANNNNPNPAQNPNPIPDQNPNPIPNPDPNANQVVNA